MAYLEDPDAAPLPDDYQFCAPVKAVERGAMAEIPVWKYRSTVMRVHDGKQEVDIDIHATQQGMPEGVRPARGDQISGTLWLQGTLSSR